MATEYKLSYTASDIDARLRKIDSLAAKDELPTKTSDLTNDSDFATETYVKEYAQPVGDYAMASEVPSVDGLASEEYVNEQINTAVESSVADWSQTDETAVDFIKNKPDIVALELINVDDIDTICGAESFSYDEAGNVSILSIYDNSTVTYDDGNVVIS